MSRRTNGDAPGMFQTYSGCLGTFAVLFALCGIVVGGILLLTWHVLTGNGR